MRLFDAAGNELAADDDTDGPSPEESGLESYLEYTFTTGGTYYLGASHWTNDAYDPVTGLGDSVSPVSTIGEFRITTTDLTATALRVTNTGDVPNGLVFSGVALREAISHANASPGADTITFAPGVFGDINLNGELQISESLEIDASGADVEIDAQGNSRALNFTATTGDLTLVDLTLKNGYTSGDNPSGVTTYSGGALRFASSGLLTLSGTTVTDSMASGNDAEGGGIFASGDVMLTDSVVSGNRTTAVGGEGGGIKSEGVVTLLRSTISDNITEGDHGDGAGVHSRRSIFVTESTVSGNTAMGIDGDGGGLFALDHINLISSTVSGNVTEAVGGDGGGLLAFDDLIMTNSTVTDNRAMQSSGGGVRVLSGNKIVDNSILAGNTAGIGNPDIVPGTGVFSVNHSLIGNGVTPDAGTSGNNVPSDAPLLDALADNGGPTETHRPLPGSPVINAGDNAMAGSTDQTGADRISGGIVDIGSVEAHPAAVRDLGVIPEGTTNEPGQAIRAGEVFFYRFELTEDVLAARGDSFVIDTFGSTLNTMIADDTEIGLFRADGTLVASNASINFPIVEAALTFGIDTAQQTSSGDLPAGEYYLALTAYGASFGADFAATRDTDVTATGTIVANFNLTQGVCVAGDLDCNGSVGASDLDLVLANWGVDTNVSGVPAGWINDLPDGVIGADELDNVLANWGNMAAPVNTPAHQPAFSDRTNVGDEDRQESPRQDSSIGEPFAELV